MNKDVKEIYWVLSSWQLVYYSFNLKLQTANGCLIRLKKIVGKGPERYK